MNRLASERSPYLLQHANNPVDWFPWGEEAFERARREDKPIFLSIGYSTCHWCHVMEHESFEDGAIAERLNRDFVSIKVDREERPDVDRVYMSFVQATTGSGGWPMTVFLTHELKPFYGGTYFPPASRWGRPGFADLLGELARVWKEERPKVETAAGGAAASGSARSPAAHARNRRSPRRRRSTPRSSSFRWRSIAGAAVLATPRSSPVRPSCCSSFGSMPGDPRWAPPRRRRFRWRPRPCGRWRSAGCAITSAAASIDTPSMARGACRTSRRCSTTRRSSCWRTSKPRRQPARASTRPSPKTRSRTSSAT